MKSFVSIAPGRLCLFGEHQDYLGLPVIAAALPLSCRIQVEPTDDKSNAGSRVITLIVPSLNKTVAYDVDNLAPRQSPQTPEPDFALAAIYEVLDDGWLLTHGARCISSSEMPMRAGCSSSSAFCVAWVQVLAELAGKSQQLSPIEIAQLAHRAEVQHFHAPGGTMDHITSAVGGVVRIGPGKWDYKTLPMPKTLGVWVLAYSGEPKETIKHLNRCKNSRLALLDKLDGRWDSDLCTKDLDETEKSLLEATRINRDTECSAARLWEVAYRDSQSPNLEPCSPSTERSLVEKLGELMVQHHAALRDGLLLSTPRLEAMNKAAMEAGSYGFKVVGSGGGGCAVAWTNEKLAPEVEQAMQKAGAPTTWIIQEPRAGACVTYNDSL